MKKMPQDPADAEKSRHEPLQRQRRPSQPAPGTAELEGADFVAVVGLYAKTGEVLAAPGATCERVPAGSLGWLLADGLIHTKGED